MGRPTASLVDEGGELLAERQLHQTGVAALAHQGEDLRPRAEGSADPGEPCAAHGDDEWYVAPRLEVVDRRGLAPVPLLRGEGRFDLGSSPLPFQGGDEGGLLAADEGTRPLDDAEVEAEVAAQDIFAEEILSVGGSDGTPESLHGQGVLGPHVDDPLLGAGGIGGDEHPLDEGVGVALHLVAVHVGAGVPFIGVADQILLPIRLPGHEVPLQTGGEAGPTTSAQSRVLDLLDDLAPAHPPKHRTEGPVAAHRHILGD